jgi:transketolase
MNVYEEDITEAYGEELIELGRQVPALVVLDADIADSCRTEQFRKAFPERAVDLGVAEQSLPTFSAGLALAGKIPFYNSFAVFDMIRQSIAYNNANVKIIGHASGQSMGYTGPSHHTIEDLSVLRALPMMSILCPCDAVEVRRMMWWMVRHEGPVYLRLTRGKVPVLHSSEYKFGLGRTELLASGSDVVIFSTGDMVHTALEVRESLLNTHIQARVVHVPTVKPLPAEGVVPHGETTKCGITIEDHNVYGGLGSAIAEIYAEHVQRPLKRLGIPDTFTESDEGSVLRNAYGLSVKDGVDAVLEML